MPSAKRLLLPAALAALQTAVARRLEADLSLDKPLDCACLDPNTASLEDLLKAPTLDRDTALRIVMGRTCFYSDNADVEKRLRETGGQDAWPTVKAALGAKSICIGCGSDLDVNLATAQALAAAQGMNEAAAKRVVIGRTCVYTSAEDLLRRVGGSDPDATDSYWQKVGVAMATNDLCSIIGRESYTDLEAAANVVVATELRQAIVNAKDISSDVAVVKSDEPPLVLRTCEAATVAGISIPKMTFGDQPLQVQCPEGFAFTADPKSNLAEVTCGDDGLFKGLEGKACRPLDCGDPVPLFGGASAVDFAGKTTYAGGQPVELRCRNGWTLSGKPDGAKSLQISCLASKAWSQTGLTCLNTACNGETVRVVTCPLGTSFDGRPCSGSNCEERLSCSTDGWSPKPRACVPITCPAPSVTSVTAQTVMQPAQVPTQFTYGQRLTFTCRVGHAFGGRAGAAANRTFTCGPEGRLIDEGLKDLKEVPQCLPVSCGPVEQSRWWLQNSRFYSALFPTVQVQSQAFGGAGATLRCKFKSRESECLNKHVVDRNFRKIDTLGKREAISITCGPNGEWVEPTVVETQTCAYPLSPKRVTSRLGLASLLPRPGDTRVLTILDSKTNPQVEVRQYDRYNPRQHWVLDPKGLIRSAFQSDLCLTGESPKGFIFKSSGFLESYLFVVKCTDVGKEPTGQDMAHEWWLNTDMAKAVRNNGGSCEKDTSCCSLAFKQFSQKLWGWLPGKSFTGQSFMTFPQPEGLVTNWKEVRYMWDQQGTITQHWEDEDTQDDLYMDVGKRVDVSGVLMRAPGSKPIQLTENFYLQAEPFPKVLKSLKMSNEDKGLAIVDFWMS